MGTGRLNKAIESIKAEREKIWFNEPDDVESLRHRLGVRGQSLTVVFFADRDMAAITKYLFAFRKVSKSEGIDLETLKKSTIELLKGDCGRFGPNFYKMKDTERIFSEAIEALSDSTTPEEYRALIEELIIYAGRFEQWIDRAIPWKELAEVFMASLR